MGANWRNIPQSELLSIIIDTLNAIAHLHDNGIMHRDLKPENLFRTNSGTTKLLDLGLAKELSKEFTKSLVGTTAYASPEQVNLACDEYSSGYTKKHDLHQLAVVYYILAAGQHPFFVADNVTMRKKETFQKILHKRLDLQRSDIVPYDQRILDLINKLGAKDPANRPTAQEALDEARAIDEAIKAEHAEELLENNVQAIVNEQNARRTNAIRVSALVANYFLENARKRTMARLVNKLKKSTRFKNMQLEERLRDLTLVNERERTEKEKLKRERDEADKKRNDALQMLEAKKQETLNEEKKKLEDDRKRFEEQQAEQRRQLQEQEARFEAMMKVKEREIVENKHRIYKDNWVRDGVLNPKLLVIQKFWKQKVVEIHNKRILRVIRHKLHKIKINLAIVLQNYYRKQHAMHCFRTKKQSTVRIQSLVRKVQAVQKYKTFLHGVIALQAAMRMKLVKCGFEKEIPTKEDRYNNIYENSVRYFTDKEVLQRKNGILVSNIEGMQKDLICPITLHRFVDPVVACDGYVYERAAIQQWFDNNHRVSPMTNEPLNDTTLIPCRNMKTIARAFDDVTGNNNNVQILDAQLQVVRGEYQQRFEESVRIRENLGMENADLRQQLATANDSIGVKDQEIANLRQELANANDTIGVKDQEIANLRQLLANANDTIESLRIQTKTYAGGNVYVGQMKDGKKHGFGSYTWANGNVYVGAYKDSLRDGKGTYTCNSGSCKGDVYVGEYKDGKRNGYGKFTNADGSIYHDGMWEDGQPVR